MSPLFDKVLVANRGEIAVRIIRTLRTLGIRSVAVYSDVDRLARHVAEADEAIGIGPAPAYLDVERIVDAALSCQAEAVHPGYGFLSENPIFRRCAASQVVFIGPPPEAIEMMGDKINAKRAVAAAGVPVVPGRDERDLSDEQLAAAAVEIGLPVLLKPAAGGGGKGMRQVAEVADLLTAIAAARREALGAFGDGTLLVERFVARPRHIEVQVFADVHGQVCSLGERECSLQRRHQKIIEEAPSILLDDTTRSAISAAATAAAKACGYVGAGTVEFIISADRPDEFFFMEMNTRLQVEHPVTEAVLGLDLVEWQLRVAAGEHLEPFPKARGHAIEARVYAEDPSRGFLPAAGEAPQAIPLARVSPTGEVSIAAPDMMGLVGPLGQLITALVSGLAPIIPPLPKGRTTVRIICQRLAPSASAASRSPAGARENTSLQMEATMGTIISPTTSPAIKIDALSGGLTTWKKGMKVM